MKIHWGRVLNAGLIAEIFALLLYKFLVLTDLNLMPLGICVITALFLFMLVGAMWVGRGIESNFILHGFLVGVIAIVYYVLINLPDTISGQNDMNNLTSALISHPPKILGGILGGYIAGRMKR